MNGPVVDLLRITGLLGDSPTRDYSVKLSSFNAFAEPELRQLIRQLELKPGMRVLDAGCGTGEALQWLMEPIGPSGTVTGIDLAAAHVQRARRWASSGIQVLQGDLLTTALPTASFDLVWCVNTLNHLHDPAMALRRLVGLLRPGGRIALGQSSLLCDMIFAWDSRLERVTNEAVRRYYRERYGLAEEDLAAVRALIGLLRTAQLQHVTARTVMIERMTPIDQTTEAYLQTAVFRGTWGERLRPYLSDEDFAQLVRLGDPHHPQYALRRSDFHFLQSFTLAVGEI